MKYFKSVSITAALLTAIFCAVTAYYYFTTPPSAFVVSAEDFPSGLSTTFTLNQLIDHITAHLVEVISIADSGGVNNMSRQEGLGPRSIRQIVVPIRALSSIPSPVFNEKWKGWNLNLCRAVGISLRAAKFLDLEVIGLPQGGWRLTALLKERPQFLAKSIGSAPRGGGACADFEVCARDLSEQILRFLDDSRLLKFYIKSDTDEANRHVVDLYKTTISEAALAADDLVAWGNAFYGLGQLDQALQKYQEALEKNSHFCPALIARGFLYYSRVHGSQMFADLKRAEADFRAGIGCDPRNEFAYSNLCSTLLREWTNSPSPKAELLTEARQHCDTALKINPQFVAAAVNVGYILYRQGQHREALQYFDNLSQRYPTSSALYVNYGFLLYLEYLAGSNEMIKQATELTLQSWNLDPSSYVAANNLGYFYYEQGDYLKAVDFWDKANGLKSDDPDCIAGLALGKYKLGDPPAAVKLLSRAIALDVHYRDAEFLKRNDNWSNQAAADLAELAKLLTPPSNGKA